MNAVQDLMLPAPRRRVEAFPALRNTGFPVINYLHDEMLACLEHGLDQAAIMTANALLEASLKLMLTLEAIFRGEELPKVQSKYRRMSLGALIDDGKARGIIPEEAAGQLHTYRELARNFYQHGNTPFFDTATAKDDNLVMSIGAFVLGEAITLISKAREESFRAIVFVDGVVRNSINWQGYQNALVVPFKMKAGERELSFGGEASPEFLAPARDLIGPAEIEDGWREL